MMNAEKIGGKGFFFIVATLVVFVSVSFLVAAISMNINNGGLVVTPDGKVGIGTATPAQYAGLHVYSTANSEHDIVVDAQGTQDTQDARLNLITLGDGKNNLGVSGTKGWAIYARGNARTGDAKNDLGIGYWDGVDGGGWKVGIYIDSATKNVGVGTSLPGAKLDVIGNIQSSGTITGDLLVATENIYANQFCDSATQKCLTWSQLGGGNSSGGNGGFENPATTNLDMGGHGIEGLHYILAPSDAARNFDIAYGQANAVLIKSSSNGDVYIGNGGNVDLHVSGQLRLNSPCRKVLSSGSAYAQCADNEIAVGGGVNCANGQVQGSFPGSTLQRWEGGCASGTISVSALCCKLI